MKLLAWNCRGLGNAPAVRGLLNCQKLERADVLFLSETKSDEKKMRLLRVKLGLENMEVVDCEGRGGGLAVMWRRGINMELKSKSKNHIDLEVSESGGDPWRFTGIYGESQEGMKYKTWLLLEDLSTQQQRGQPWLCAGDFNEILFQYEKEGGVQRPQVCMDRFKRALELGDLHDLGFQGDVFTWRNKQTKGSTHIRERLDRAVANFEWLHCFPLVHVKNGDPYHSDHRPVVITTGL
jgi:exonuclease III